MSQPTPFELSLVGCRTPEDWQSVLERIVPLLYGKDAELWKQMRALSSEFGDCVFHHRYENELTKDCSLADVLALIEARHTPNIGHFKVTLAQADQVLGRAVFLKAVQIPSQP